MNQRAKAKDRRSLGDVMIESGLTSAVVAILTLATGVALARLLGPDARGQYGAVQFWGQFAGTLLTFSLFEALVVRLRVRGDPPKSAVPLALLILVGIILVSVLVVCMASATGAFNVSGLSSVTVAGFVLLIAVSAFVNRAFITIETAGLSFRRLNVERVLSPTLFLICAGALYVLDRASVPAVLAAFVLSKLPIIFLRVTHHRRHLVGEIDFKLAHEVRRLAPSLFVAAGCMGFAQQFDRLIVTLLWPSERVGFYFVAFSATGAGLALASQAIRVTLIPSLAGLEPTELREKTERLVRLSVVAAILVVAPIFAFAHVLVPLIYGADFAPAVAYVRSMAFAMALLPTLQIVSDANRAAERGQPGVEMALVILAVYGVGYVVTEFSETSSFFITMA